MPGSNGMRSRVPNRSSHPMWLMLGKQNCDYSAGPFGFANVQNDAQHNEENERDREVRDLSRKLRYLNGLLSITDEEFCAEIGERQRIRDARTPRAWLSGESGDSGETHHIPGRRNQQNILEYFKYKFGVGSIAPQLLKCSWDDFVEIVGKIQDDQNSRSLQIPVARRLGRLLPRNIEMLSGKYVLYRYSMRFPSRLVSEVFTLSPSNDGDYLEMRLRSSPENDSEHEVYAGRFFRYGYMYWAVITFFIKVGQRKVDMMRVLHFPEVERPQGLYFGLMTADAHRPVQAVAVRCFARRISTETSFNPEDDSQIWIIPADKQPTSPPNIKLEQVKTLLRSGLQHGQLPHMTTYHHEEDVESLLPPE
jgi:hypothetical protein